MLFRKNSLLVIALAAAAVLVGMSGVAQATLIGYWNLDENTSATSALDGGLYGYNLTPTQYGSGTVPASGRTGVIGKAWQFYGTTSTSSSLQAANAGNLSGMTYLTLSAWVNISSSAPWSNGVGVTPGLIRARYSSSDVYTLQYTNPPQTGTCNNGIAGLVGGKTGSVTNTTYPAVNGWSMATFTYSGATGAEVLYLNGVYKASITSATGTVRSSTSTVFALSGVATFTGYSVTGYADDAGVWNEALLQVQVMAMYQAPVTFSSDAALGYYGQKDMQSLFTLYGTNGGTPAAPINGKQWLYSANLVTSLPGIVLPGIPSGLNSATDNVGIFSGAYFVQLDANGGGVYTSAIPEPSTLALLAAGLVGLLCYAWRKRK